MQKILIVIIKTYQYLFSPWLGNQCRFTPSCSHYTIEAIERHGAVKGTLLGVRRLGCCHPWHEGGLDPVPQRKTSSSDFNPTPSKPHG